MASFSGAEERADTFRGWLRSEGFEVSLLSEAQAASGGLDRVELLIVPHARDLPLSFWELLPPYHANGHHLLFEGVPLRTGHNGSEKFVPGIGPDLHLYFETGELPGLPERGEIELRQAENELSKLPGLPRKVQARSGGARSIQAWVHRYARDTTGHRAYREDLLRVLFGWYDDADELRAQQAVLVRHHCRQFGGATTGFIDVTHPGRQEFALLSRRSGAAVLGRLVREAFETFPGERQASDYAQLLALKESLEELRNRLVEAEYVWRDLAMLIRHAEAPGGRELGQELVALIPNATDLLDTYHSLRSGPPELAWNLYEALASRARETAASLLSVKDRMEVVVRESRRTAPRQEHTLPGGELIYGFASTPVRWGFRDGPLLHAMKRAGMQSYTDWVFDADILAERGGPRLSLYEFLNPLPKIADEPWAQTEEHTVLDLVSGRSRISSRPVPVIDPVYESPEYARWLSKMAASYADEDWINSRVVTSEEILRKEDAHGPNIQPIYRRFLAKRHGRIEELNHRWGTHHQGFEDVQSPRRFPETRSARANWFDFADFRAQRVAAYLDRIVTAYHAADDRHAIVGCLNQHSPLSGVDFFAVSEVLDRVSSHNWPTSLPWYNPGLAARPGQRGENNELKATRAAYRWTPKSERGHQWRVRFYTLYTWARGVVEQEEHHWGMLGSGRTGERGSGLMGEVDGFLRLPGAEVGALNRTKPSWEGFSSATPPHENAQVGLYWSFATKSQGRGTPPVKRLGDDYFYNAFMLNDRWNGWLDAAQIPFETVPRQKVKRGQLDHLRLIIVPQAPFLEQSVMEGLLAWVERGGHLLVIGQAGRFDEYAAPTDGLLEPLGLIVIPAPEAPVRWRGRQLKAPGLHAWNQPGSARRLQIDGPGEVLAADTAARTVAIRRKHGRGQLTVLGFSPSGDLRVSAAKLPAGDTGLAFFQEILRDAGVHRAAWGRSPQDRLAVWQGTGGWSYGVLQNFSAQRRDVQLVIQGRVSSVFDVALELPLRSTWLEGNTLVVVPLVEGDGRVLAWRSKTNPIVRPDYDRSGLIR